MTSTAVATELGSVVQRTAERVGPAVVGFGRGWGRGGGVVVAPGRVLTNAHNLRGEEIAVRFHDGRTGDGKLAGVDPDLDLAAIEVEAADGEPVAWSPQSTGVSVGTPVVALANPGGRGLRATFGFVSATERGFRGARGRRIASALEHTAPLPRGSGGGPLVDVEGRLLGLNTVRLEGGLIVAIRADQRLATVAERLFRGEAVSPRRLGVAIAPPPVARRLRRSVGLPDRPGLLVRAVEADSVAERAGIERGDLIAGVNGRELEAIDALYEALDALAEGETLKLDVVCGIDERDIVVQFDRS